MKRFNLLRDIYYSKQYASLYLTGRDTLFEFDYQNGVDRFFSLSVKSPIDKIGDIVVSDGYYDLETAYGYGGYYCSTSDPFFLQKALGSYSQRCLEENIVAEFIRFHPYNDFPSFGAKCLDFLAFDRSTVSINLSIEKDERWSQYSGTTRNILRKCEQNLSFQETDDIDAFMHLYQLTMEKNSASFFYYFSREYYEKLLALENIKLFAVKCDSVLINMSFVLIGKTLAHYHLSANNQTYSKLNGNYFLLNSVCDYVRKYYPEIEHFLLGGGRTNFENDSLLAFKSKFSHIRNDFYIAGKVFNQEVYQRYNKVFCESNPELKNVKFFLKYRMDNV